MNAPKVVSFRTITDSRERNEVIALGDNGKLYHLTGLYVQNWRELPQLPTTQGEQNAN
jgi:hypothetical protein